MSTDIRIKKSNFIEKWMSEMTRTMKQANPEWDEEDIREVLLDMVDKDIKNPPVNLDNNYTHENRDSTLLSVFDWIEERKPIIAGNGTFYKNQDEAINPIANMLDDKLTMRKKYKKVMFNVGEDIGEDTEEYKYWDRSQGNEKRIVNSYYGGSGTPVSPFYSLYSGPSTTLTAQQVISTTETTFEAFLADNFYFIDINECFFWLNCVIDEEYELDSFVNIISLEKVYERLRSRFMEWDDNYHDVLWNYLKHLTPDEWTRIYYKNNLITFISDHDDMKSLVEKVFRKVENVPHAKYDDDIPHEYRTKYPTAKKYNIFVNERRFMNPNVIPDTVKKEMDLLNTLCMKYVYIPFLAFDRIYRLKYFERRAVVIVDTDSNILNCTPWIEYCQENIMKSNYGREEIDNVFIGVNTITYMLTNVVGEILMFYGEHANIPESFRGRFNMKNEFFFTKLIIGRKKKRYISMIKLREGSMYDPEKFDIKGFDFMKSGTSEKASELYSRLAKEKLLIPETPDIKGLMFELRQFEKEIRRDLEQGRKTYLPIVNVKEDAAYKPEKIWSVQSKKAVFCWNAIYPDNTIELPSKVNILKLNIFREEDMEPLQKRNPELYDRIINKVFNSRNVKIAKSGLQAIAIPSNVDIPEWLIPYIAYDTIINNILKQFGSVLEMVDIPYVKVGKTINGIDRKSKKFSNIINF